jgi:hypothetical protein
MNSEFVCRRGLFSFVVDIMSHPVGFPVLLPVASFDMGRELGFHMTGERFLSLHQGIRWDSMDDGATSERGLDGGHLPGGLKAAEDLKVELSGRAWGNRLEHAHPVDGALRRRAILA